MNQVAAIEVEEPKIDIVQTVSVSEILVIYDQNPINFIYMCFAIAKIFENRGLIAIPPEERNNYRFITPEQNRFRDPYDYLNLNFRLHHVLSDQTEAQLWEMLRAAGYALHFLDSRTFSVNLLRSYEGTSFSEHNYRIKLLKAILEHNPSACFHFVIKQN